MIACLCFVDLCPSSTCPQTSSNQHRTYIHSILALQHTSTCPQTFSTCPQTSSTCPQTCTHEHLHTCTYLSLYTCMNVWIYSGQLLMALHLSPDFDHTISICAEWQITIITPPTSTTTKLNECSSTLMMLNLKGFQSNYKHQAGLVKLERMLVHTTDY